MEQEQEFAPETYTEEELDALDNHIEQYFGEYTQVFHEIFSPDIHVDICIIPPTPERNWITLVTQGMGAHRMDVPEELAEEGLERAEMLICLPPDWKLDSEDEKDYWVIRLLKSLARLPIECETWLGWGHSIDNQKPFAENTKLCAALLLSPGAYAEDACVCELPDGEQVNFYQVFPIYAEEMSFKIKYGTDPLLDLMAGAVGHVLDIRRCNVCTDIMDCEDWHAGSIREKNLPLDEITGYNHMAIYLRWCIEHDLMSDQFLEDFEDAVNSVRSKDGRVDLRELIRDEFSGMLYRTIFNETGRQFAAYYYDHSHDDGPCYPADVDDYALRYFGEERYNSEEFQDEAYLFIPYDETFYKGMKVYIDHYFTEFCKIRSEV
ncbi:suppressor of fused domain protein [Porcipelethomonas sp.]|uniref:suppressor of fused domain protein n=1 Tax=Porcipelethomonas sp. TaxID=2981675 RepID=UPI003EF501AE